ncbi:MAG: UDP-glucose--hexose-1-phosphate uridylyltransferase, partial [Planctomycetota bacterium]|nr:UDP-glucose--hexose-1-phosphate uridylyltransferase [Planctomycetota bacterium]
MNRQINRLLNFALQRGLLSRDDLFYAANRLLDILGETAFHFEAIDEELASPAPILEEILALAVKRSLLEDTAVRRDLFDTRVMDCLTPRPAEVVRRFRELHERSPEEATDYFYDLCIASNYIRKTRTDANIVWPYASPYGELEITINLSKPEKDPRDIAAARGAPATGYPSCLLCRENEGFAGNLLHPARQNLRLVPVPLPAAGEEEWFMQYSPYIYYNEHCIFLNAAHAPMKIDRATFTRLLEILDFLPHYFAGSNADLPIVGGSILSHDHYQGGRHLMPLDRARIEKSYVLPAFPGVSLGRVEWPLSTLRLNGADKTALADLAEYILGAWREYSDPGREILARSGHEPHNTVTPLARMRDGRYELDLVLRNNRTSPEHPLGIFHPHADVHHVKKENIGLIEATGLAILPARLLEELRAIEDALAAGRESLDPAPELEKHADWYRELRPAALSVPRKDLPALIRDAVGAKFLRCLLDAGVFKRDENGLAG